MSGKPKKVKLPKRTPVRDRKRKKGVAKRPPPNDRSASTKWVEPSLDLGIEKLREMAKDHGIVFNARTKPGMLVQRLEEFKNPAQSKKVEWLALRHAACLRYITDHRGISIKKLSEQELFKDSVSYETFQRWSMVDKWVERRSEFFENIRDDIKKNLGKRLVDIQVDQLKELDVLYHESIKKLKAKKLKPKSLEGMITALVKLVTASNELRDKIAKEIVPEHLGGAQGDGMQVTPKLTEEEARAAAMAIIHQRRAKMRATATDSGEEEKPQLRLVDGGANEKT